MVLTSIFRFERPGQKSPHREFNLPWISRFVEVVAVADPNVCSKLPTVRNDPHFSRKCSFFRFKTCRQVWKLSLIPPPQQIHTSYRGERIVFWWPNTNTNIIRASENDWIRIRILFGSTKTTKYEYEYYSAFQKWPNTNTNINGLSKNTNNIYFCIGTTMQYQRSIHSF